MADMQAAAQRKTSKMRFKGKYAGPDKFKGVIPEGYKGKAKGKYFGKDSRQGANVERTKTIPSKSHNDPIPTGSNEDNRSRLMPVGYDEWQKRKDEATAAGKSYIDGWKSEGTEGKISTDPVSVGKRPMPIKKLKDPNRFKKYAQRKPVGTPADTEALTQAVEAKAQANQKSLAELNARMGQ